MHEGITDAEIVGDRYVLHRRDRGSRGGGILIGVKPHLASLVEWKDDIHECMCVKVITGKSVVRVIVAYRPPHTGVELMEEINRRISDKLHGSLVIGGDFNMPEVVWDMGGCRSAAQLAVNDLLGTNDLTQVVKEGTRISTVSNKHNILDVILLKSNMKYNNCDVVDGIGDHRAVLLNLHCNNRRKDNVSPRLVRQYKKANRKGIEKFLRDEFPKWASSNTEDVDYI